MDEENALLYEESVENEVNRRFYFEEGFEAGLDIGEYRNPYNRIRDEVEHDYYQRGYIRGRAVKRQKSVQSRRFR